jgi:hypothetical protein
VSLILIDMFFFVFSVVFMRLYFEVRVWDDNIKMYGKKIG